MKMDILFYLNSILFGIGLAMDAFSVSIANGLNEPNMHPHRSLLIAGTFGAFQTAMPLLGWFCVHSVAETFSSFQPYIPWIALILLLYIGIKMLAEGIKNKGNTVQGSSLRGGALLMQGLATSIDALSVGFTTADYNFVSAIVEALIIGIVTLIICLLGLFFGRKIGIRIAGKAGIIGGIVLILIGIEIFIKGML